MNKKSQLEQWRGAFGDAYIERNQASDERLRSTNSLWARLLSRVAGDPPASILEVGANIGVNLEAIRLVSAAELWALEPNQRACEILTKKGIVSADHALNATAQSIPLGTRSVDMAFTCGVLIHIAPADLRQACSEIYRCARKYIICIEYFADRPEEKTYRGETELLFKRDFGSFWMDEFPDLIPLDWGFNWRRTTGLDNSTYWIFAKPQR